jgi:hypothetical protein
MSQPRDVLARNCPVCGAQLDATPPGRAIVCRYCGHSFQPAPEFNPPQRVIVIGPGTRPLGAPVRRAVGRSIFSGMFSLIVVGVVAFVSMRGRSTSSLVPTIAEMSSTIAIAVPATFLWDTVAGPPIPAAVGGGGVEGFVGRIRSRGGDALWIAAFEGKKLGQVWKVGPFGTHSEGYRSTFAEVVGRDVIVTDYRANLHVVDLATGHETRTLKLTDRAKGMCASPDGKAHVWIEMTDEKNVLFDADAGTSTLSPRPAWCPDSYASSGDDCRGWLKRGDARPGCKGPDVAPKVAGFEAENVIEEGDLAVAFGKKHPGTATPIVVGFDPRTKAVRWQQALASGDQAGVEESSTAVMDALAGGRFVAPYKTSKAFYLTAFDARSGQRVWDVTLQPLIGIDTPEGFSMSATRVYVMRTSSLEVYDAANGALVGSIGD